MHNRSTVYLSLFMLLQLLGFSSCGPNYHYSETTDLQNEEWSYDQVLEFEFPISDTLQIYNLILDITHDVDYPFQNLYTRISTHFPSGEQINKTLSLELANKAGQWQGKCGRQYCHLKIPIQEGAYFNVPGNYKISLEQFMRINPTQGIRQIALHIEETENRRAVE